MNERISRKELARRLAAQTKMSSKEADRFLCETFELIARTVVNGDSVVIQYFGTFEPKVRAPRMARNPRTGKVVPIPARVDPWFRAAPRLRTVVNRARTVGLKLGEDGVPHA